MPANDQFWRPLSTMHKVFAVSALVLLLATWIMMAKDHRDEWRQYQTTADELKAAQLDKQLSAVHTPAYEQRRGELQQQQDAAQALLDEQQAELATQRADVARIQGEVDLLARQTKFEGAERDVARANYDIAVRDNRPESERESLKARFDELQASVNEMTLQLDVKKRELQQIKDAAAQSTADYDRVAAELKNLQADSERITKALVNIAPGDGNPFQRFKRWLMLQPIVDGFNSPHGINQEWLPDLPITIGMTQTARFDRCRTCHVNINDFGPGNVPNFPHGELADGKYPHPYSSHPNPDVFVSSISPHPMPRFGCTICHDGDGSGTSFQNAEHTPNDPAQARRWHEEHGWHSNHYWEYPMQPSRFIESSCLKCHHSVVELGINKTFGPTAPKLFEGFETIKTYGCFGCHDINGFDGDRPIGPDMRLEGNYVAAAAQLLNDSVFATLPQPESLDDAGLIGLAGRVEDVVSRTGTAGDDAARRELISEANSLSTFILQQARPLAEQVEADPHQPEAIDSLRNLVVASTSLATAARSLQQKLPESDRSAVTVAPYLSPQSWGLADAFKQEDHPGRERKVGPSLRHIGSKLTPEFVAFWTEMPSQFRPDTRMPQFFHLSNQQDEQAQRYQPVQLAAIAAYLQDKSQTLELLQPKADYVPDPERGKKLFAERGCLACHQHNDPLFAGSTATFGPDLSREHEKIKPGKEGFDWLYTWIRDPMRHHPRTKMPNLFLEPEGEGDSYVDPAADIAAFLLQGGPKEFPALAVDTATLDELFEMFVRKTLTNADYETMVADRAFPRNPLDIKGDEIELARRTEDAAQISDEEWQHRKMVYVGRRTISFYGCFGCHDIPEFETARPIGTALQDWGRKDTSRLALEHIEEFLHHHGSGHADDHGDAHGNAPVEHTVPEVAEQATQREFYDGDAPEFDLSTAFFYESLQHHGRPGFIWQKLRQPRSYDFMKVETKGYDERLRMPKFPFNDEQIEAVTTFVLGLVAEPPPSEYLYQPTGRPADVIEGERLLDKYNCGGCHVIDLPKITFAANPDEMTGSELGPADFEQALNLLLKLKPPRDGLVRTPVGDPVELPSGDNVVEFEGLIFAEPDYDDDPEFQEFSFDLWETLKIEDKTMFPGAKMLVPATKMIDQKPARGGDFAEWLVPHLMESQTEGNRFLAWQASPPPLYREGDKVQTPWLYEFLKNPDRLRFTTVLRMPKFNMSDAEARSLANYFAAADGAVYPYQSIPETQPPYLDARQVAFHDAYPNDDGGYLEKSWNLLNAPLCIKCHSVGGNQYTSSDPKRDIRGPDLDRVAKRLRPDWTLLWLFKPAWITPYTSMPTVFPRNQTQLPEFFGGDGQKQTVAVRDALMNYYKLMEAHGSLAYTPEGAEAAPQEEAEQNAAPQTGAGGQ